MKNESKDLTRCYNVNRKYSLKNNDFHVIQNQDEHQIAIRENCTCKPFNF